MTSRVPDPTLRARRPRSASSAPSTHGWPPGRSLPYVPPRDPPPITISDCWRSAFAAHRNTGDLRVLMAGEADVVNVIEVIILKAKERSEEHTSELQSPYDLVCRLLLEKKKKLMQY